ncbi:MAG: ChbG/HpnK family deacetylase [Actinomycetota bacterium]|nr:ChbG/HpnK family deacetylase [Actinomycetota bacterium]
MSDLALRLGFAADDRVVLVCCDELGFSHAANVATYAALRSGTATSASLMVPAPWSRGAAAAYRGEDVGCNLTLNAELDLYRWGPITHAPSLLDGDGGFPRTVTDVWEHADLDEVRREWRAQVERAIYWGFDVSHLDAHLGGVEMKPEFFDAYLDLAEELRLPVRLPDAELEPRVGFPFRSLADERGILAPDRSLPLTALGRTLGEALASLPPGVSELHAHPAPDAPEMRLAAPDWERRVDEHALLSPGGPLAEALARTGARLVGYRELREAMRAGRSGTSDFA